MALTDNLTFKYLLDADATDSINGIDGTSTGTSFDTAPGRSFASFDGNDYITVPHNAATQNFNGDFTFSMWFKSSGSGGGNSVLFSKMYHSATGGHVVGTVVYINENNVGFYLRTKSANYFAFHPAVVTDNQWHLLTVVRDGSEMTTFVDGVADTTITGITGTSDSAQEMQIGRWKNSTGNVGQYYTGAIDELSLWDRAISNAEVEELYAQRPLEDDLVAKYALDTDVTDSVGSNDGTSHGGAAFETTNNRDVLRLSAHGDYAQIPESLNIGSSGPYTFSVWVKPDNFDSYQTLISDHVYGSDMPSFMIEIMPTSGNVRVRHYNSNSASVQLILSTNALVAGQWNLVTVTWDSSTVAVYLDGTLDNSGALTYVPWNSSAPYRVGADTYPNIHVRGLMDDLHIWNRALSASEVTELHSSTLDLEDGLVAKYDLNTDGSDSIGSNDLVAFGGALPGTSHDGRDAAQLPRAGGAGLHPTTPIPLGSSYTISAMFKDLKNRQNSDADFLMLDGSSASGTGNGIWAGGGIYTIAIFSNDELGIFRSASAGGSGFVSSGFSMTQANFSGDNSWHHIAAVNDNGTVTFYVDGVQAGNPVAHTQSDIQAFGSWAQTYNHGFADYVDQVLIYDRALSENEVIELHNNNGETQGENNIMTNLYVELGGMQIDAYPSEPKVEIYSSAGVLLETLTGVPYAGAPAFVQGDVARFVFDSAIIHETMDDDGMKIRFTDAYGDGSFQTPSSPGASDIILGYTLNGTDFPVETVALTLSQLEVLKGELGDA